MRAGWFMLVSIVVSGCAPLSPADAADCSGGGGEGGEGGSGGAPPACETPDDCTGPDWRCEHRTCIDGVCGTEYAPDGTPDLQDSFPGDCAQLVCNGQGRSRRAFSKYDIPNDGNPCTIEVCVGDYNATRTVTPGVVCLVERGGNLVAGVCSAEGDCETKE